MTNKKINSPYYYLNSRHLTLSDFGLKINGKTQNEKQFISSINDNMFLNFIEKVYNCAIIVFSKYSSDYSNHLYTQPLIIHYFSYENIFKSYLSWYNRLFGALHQNT